MKTTLFRTLPLYLALAAAMAALNFALPLGEPLAFPLYFAALACGLDPFLAGAGYLLSSAVSLSLFATLSAAVQTAFLLVVVCIYRRFRRPMGIERALYALLAQLPFVFLFPFEGYALFPFGVLWQKAVFGVFFTLLCLLFEGGLSALLHRAFRCRLAVGELAELALFWLFLGLGILGALGRDAFALCALTGTLFGVILLQSAAVPLSVALCLPLAVASGSVVPVAEYALYACAALLLLPYGRAAASLSMFGVYAASLYFEGAYGGGALAIVLSLLACALPALAAALLPPAFLKKLRSTFLFYRERTLPRIAVNRNRRAVGEQLYEVSALFREIENAFDFGEEEDDTTEQLKQKLIGTLCTGCRNRALCERDGRFTDMEKLIAVGKAKGRVNLIDLPVELSQSCLNSAGLLFALNRHLADYRRVSDQLQWARAGRKLLAEQARGVSEVLKELALEQSEEYVISEEGSALAAALAKEGLLSSEIFLYGEGPSFTVSLTLESKASGKKVAAIASEALRIPLALAEKLPLTSDRACFILKRKARFDATFGVASRVKEGSPASGDTHSFLKIDERRFMVALSDGMGSGEEAHDISDRTLTLLESFYKAKMPSETVLSTVNQLIAFSSQESFSCLDLAAVDLDTGVADIVKIGSPVGFVLSGETLQVLEGESLPIGALEAVHPATLRVEMKADDFLIFMSDGVTSAFGSSADLCAYLSRIRPLNPQSLAEEILKNALSHYGGRAEDDMTVLAVKLTETA